MDTDDNDDYRLDLPSTNLTSSSASSQASNPSKKRSHTNISALLGFGRSVDDGDSDSSGPPKKSAEQQHIDDYMKLHNINPANVAQITDQLSSTVMSNKAVLNLAHMIEGYSTSGSEQSQRNRDRRRKPASTPLDSNSERDEDLYQVVENPSRPLSDYPGFAPRPNGTSANTAAAAAAPSADAMARDFVEDMIHGIHQPPVIANNSINNRSGNNQRNYPSDDMTTPTRYTSGFGVNFDPSSSFSNDRRRQPWKSRGGATGTGQDDEEKPLDFSIHLQAGKHKDILNDREIISLRRANDQFNDLIQLHAHWQERLHRPEQDLPAAQMTVREAKTHKLFKKTSYNAYLLLVELVRRVNFDNLVAAGVIATNPARNPNESAPSTAARISESARRRAQKDANDADTSMFLNNDTPICMATIEAAVIAEKKRLYAVYLELTNNAPTTFTKENRTEVGRLWGELNQWLQGSLQMVCGFYTIRFVNASHISRLASEMSLIELETFKNNEANRFNYFMSTKMAALKFRRGPKADMIYREHFIDGILPSNYWIADRTIKTFVKQIISPDNGVEAIQYWNYARGKVDKIVAGIVDGDDSMFPKVNPIRGLIGFSNGILDMVTNEFYRVGTPAYSKNVVRTFEYKYVCNFFKNPYPSEGYSDEDGKLEIEDGRLAPYDENGMPDWAHPERMPPNHWCRKFRVPLLQHNIETQKWDLHTIANFWFAFGRLAHSNGDNLQFAPFLKGVAGSGKSTFLQFPILMTPPEYRAIIQASADVVFALQLLIGTNEKFVKWLGAVCDMNGKMSLPTSMINSLITGEFVTTDVKFGDQRTARADMCWVFAGNQFFDDGANGSKEMPSKIRRFWQFILNTVPVTGDTQVNEASILAAMPYYIRVTTEVFHEFNTLKELSPNEKVRNSTDPWFFASPYLKNIKMNTMMGVSKCSKFVSSEDWIIQTNDAKDYLSLDSLRFVSHTFNAHSQGMGGSVGMKGYTGQVPTITSIEDAIRMIYPQNTINEWGEETTEKLFETTPHILVNGLTCQLGDVINTTSHKFVTGLKIHPDRFASVLECMPSHFGNAASANTSVITNTLNMPAAKSATTNKRRAPTAKRSAKVVASNPLPSPPVIIANPPKNIFSINNGEEGNDSPTMLIDGTPYFDDEDMLQNETLLKQVNLPPIVMEFDEDPDTAQ